METKNRKLKIFIILGMMLLITSAFAACKDADKNTYSLPDVAEGETFEIILDAHGGTAYSWNYDIHPDTGIEYVTMEYVAESNDSDQNGGGQLVYTFQAIKAGGYKIQFELQIPWESEPPIETNVYEITVVNKNS